MRQPLQHLPFGGGGLGHHNEARGEGPPFYIRNIPACRSICTPESPHHRVPNCLLRTQPCVLRSWSSADDVGSCVGTYCNRCVRNSLIARLFWIPVEDQSHLPLGTPERRPVNISQNLWTTSLSSASLSVR